jgi:hypothetical protein
MNRTRLAKLQGWAFAIATAAYVAPQAPGLQGVLRAVGLITNGGRKLG